MNTSLSAIACGIALLLPCAAIAQQEATFPVIVVFHKDTPFHQFRSHARADERSAAHAERWDYLERDVLGAVNRLEGYHRFKSRHVFSHAVKGFAGDLTAAQLDALKAEPTVAYIEPDVPVRVRAQTLPWGIDRVEADLSTTFSGNGSGTVANVNVYVIDTGIAGHRDLNIVRHVNFADAYNYDCNGHGTHVAGTIGAADDAADVVGVVPGVKLTGVKVLDCTGNGLMSNVIKGVDWVTANAIKPAVANMSLSGGASQALDDAIMRSVNSKVFYAVAAGNDGADACNSSPARAGFNSGGLDNGVVTTAATDSYNLEASWSNYGQCINMWAPGVNVVSTRRGGGTAIMSGTSMATPHVAGAAALYLSRNASATPAQVETTLRSNALLTGTKGKDGRAILLLQVNRF